MSYPLVGVTAASLMLVAVGAASPRGLNSRSVADETLRPGVYTASGDGSQMKLTVVGLRVQITYGTYFRYICAGPLTKSLSKRSPEVLKFDFHPGWALHPISASGNFTFSLFHTKLDGRFTNATTAKGSFQFNGGAKSECHGDHKWTATLGGKPPATITAVAPPVTKGTVGYRAMQKGLLEQPHHGVVCTVTGADIQRVVSPWEIDASDPNRALNSKTGQNALWDDQKQQWMDTKTGTAVSPSGLADSGKTGYRAMQKGLLEQPQHGVVCTVTGADIQRVVSPWEIDASDPNRALNSKTGQNALWDDQKQQWMDTKTGQAVSPSGLTVPAP